MIWLTRQTIGRVTNKFTVETYSKPGIVQKIHYCGIELIILICKTINQLKHYLHARAQKNSTGLVTNTALTQFMSCCICPSAPSLCCIFAHIIMPYQFSSTEYNSLHCFLHSLCTSTLYIIMCTYNNLFTVIVINHLIYNIHSYVLGCVL